jgi:hypothetical protein
MKHHCDMNCIGDAIWLACSPQVTWSAIYRDFELELYYLFTNEDLSIINIFGKCIIECLETRKLKQVLWYWNIFSLSIYIINFFLRLWTRQETLYLYIFFIYICIIASNDNNQCMQFVCPYCGPIDWNNKYSYSYYYSCKQCELFPLHVNQKSSSVFLCIAWRLLCNNMADC